MIFYVFLLVWVYCVFVFATESHYTKEIFVSLCMLLKFYYILYKYGDNQGFFVQSKTYRCSHSLVTHPFLCSWSRLLMISFPMRLTLSMYSETGYLLALSLLRAGSERCAPILQWPKQSLGTVFLKIRRFWYNDCVCGLHSSLSAVALKYRVISDPWSVGNLCVCFVNLEFFALLDSSW